jgi:hypothetical protein
MTLDELAQEMCKREDTLDHLTAKAEVTRLVRNCRFDLGSRSRCGGDNQLRDHAIGCQMSANFGFCSFVIAKKVS